MPTFKEYVEQNPKLAEAYEKWRKDHEEGEWEEFSESHQGAPEAAPSDLLDVNASIASGTLGNLLGGVTGTVGNLTEGLLGGVTGKSSPKA